MMNVRKLGGLLVAGVLVVGCGPGTTAGDGSTAGDDGGDAGTTGGDGDGDGGGTDDGVGTTGESSTGTGSSTGDPTIPEGCEDLFDDGEFSCPGSETEGCDFLAGQPDRLALWTIQFYVDLGGTGEPEDNISDFERKAACVEAYLDGLGIEHQPIDREHFYLTASYAQVEPLCRASMIDDCRPNALEGECELLDEAGCWEIPLCSDYGGWRIEPGASCYEADVFAICLTQHYACGDMVSPMRGPDGACWLFGENCLETQPGWQLEPPDCPSLDDWDTIPECG